MSGHLSNGFLCSRWLVDASTVTNWYAYFNKLTADIPYISHANPTKNGIHLNIRMWFHMCNLRQNRSFHVAIGMNWTVESRSLWPGVVNFWIELSDSSIQTGFPKKNILEGERAIRNTWIPLAGVSLNNAPLHEAV